MFVIILICAFDTYPKLLFWHILKTSFLTLTQNFFFWHLLKFLFWHLLKISFLTLTQNFFFDTYSKLLYWLWLKPSVVTYVFHDILNFMVWWYWWKTMKIGWFGLVCFMAFNTTFNNYLCNQCLSTTTCVISAYQQLPV